MLSLRATQYMGGNTVSSNSKYAWLLSCRLLSFTVFYLEHTDKITRLLKDKFMVCFDMFVSYRIEDVDPVVVLMHVDMRRSINRCSHDFGWS